MSHGVRFAAITEIRREQQKVEKERKKGKYFKKMR